MSRGPLEQMAFEALQVSAPIWAREFPSEEQPRAQWETYTRCITFMIGGVYPDSTWDRPEMQAWQLDVSAVRRALTDAAELGGCDAYAALPLALNTLRELVSPDHRDVA